MKRFWFYVFFGLAASLSAQQAAPEEGRSRFCAMDIFLDSKSTPLAAYQLEFAVTNNTAKIVGIEGGEHAAFREPPFYDPKAMQDERVIIAAFSTAPAAALPVGKTRIATIHLQVDARQPLQALLKLKAAADADGKRIFAEATFQETQVK